MKIINKKHLKKWTFLFVISVFCFSIFQPTIFAISAEQKKLYDQNILYYDLEAGCTPTTESTPTDTTALPSNDTVKDLAIQMLATSTITYWTNNGVNTRDVVVALSQGRKAFTTAPDGQPPETDINPNILKFILESATKGKVMVNALTDKDHSTGSNHYKGLAVDLDNNPGNTTVPVGKLIEIATKYGGTKNSETTHHHFDFTDQASVTPQNTPNASLQTRNITEPDTLRAKIAQMMFVGVADKNNAKELVDELGIGGVMLVSGGTSLFNKEAIAELQSVAAIPLLIASDEEGGSVQRLKSQTGSYPSAKVLGTKTNEEVRKIATEYGNKLKELGVNVNYAPVVDIDDGRNSIISGKDRAFSATPGVIAQKAGAFAEGMRAANITPVFKHFPGHGRADGDSHNEVVTTPNINTLRNSDLKPYSLLLRTGLKGVMVGHLVVPGLTNGQPATLSKEAVSLLRSEYGFGGVVFSDEIANMAAIRDRYTVPEAISLAIQAGIDMPLFNKSPSYATLKQQVTAVINKIEQDVNSGLIPQATIDQAVNRITVLKNSLPLADNTANQPSAVTNGCVCSASSSISDDLALDGDDNIAKAYDFFVNRQGFTPELASAFIGNFRQESGSAMSPTVVNGIGATGIAQWLGGRKNGLFEFGQSKDRDPLTLEVQLEYVMYELNNAESRAYSKIKAVTGSGRDYIATVTHVIRKYYERPGESEANDPRRIEYALEVFQSLGQGIASVTSDTADTPSTPGVTNCPQVGSSGSSLVSSDGYSFPVEPQRQLQNSGVPGMTSFPCPANYNCHGGRGVGTAYDIGRKPGGDASAGAAVYAFTAGVIESYHIYNRTAGCYSFQLKGDDGFYYWYGHLGESSLSDGDRVTAGQAVSQVGPRKCTGNESSPHLHIDRGCVRGGVPQRGGGEGCRDGENMKKLMNKLFLELPK